MQLPGAPNTNPSAFWNQQMSASSLLGLSPGAPRGNAGDQLPRTSHAGNDSGAVPWSPDSPIFWLGVVVAATALGITGASVRVRAFKAHAGADLGNS